MKIVFLTRLYYPHIGGVEKHIAGITQELNSGNEISIITEKYSPELLEFEEKVGLKIYRIPVVGVGESAKKWVIWGWILKHRHLLDSADIIHVHDIMYWLYPYKLIRPFKKLFITFHGWEGIYPLPLKNIFQKRLDSYLATGNICVGSYISKWYGIKADLVTYGACTQPHKTNSNRKINHQAILFLGRLDQDTGFLECLQTFSRLNDQNNYQLIVAGDGPLRDRVPKSATMLGFVTNPEVYIEKADYVFTTGYLGILESWVRNKPVISSYSNPLKKDYLFLHPQSQFLNFSASIPSPLSPIAYNWAKAQTWAKLALLYQNLWSK